MQRFGSAANLNVHLHIIALDGAYEKKSTGRLKFYNTIAPTKESTTKLVHDIAKRINNHLLRKGYLERHEDLVLLDACVNVGGYSVHAATAVKLYERNRLERLVRYIPDRPERKEAMDEDSPAQQPPLLNKKRGKKRVGWAALLKRTFKIDVLQCHKCGSRMQLVDVVLHAALIATTLKAIGVSPRAPPIAPARSVGVFGFDEAFIDSDCIDLAYNNEETLSS